MTTPPLRAAIIPVTPLQQNCSLIWCTETMLGALVDPGGDLPKLKAAVETLGTHCASTAAIMCAYQLGAFPILLANLTGELMGGSGIADKP